MKRFLLVFFFCCGVGFAEDRWYTAYNESQWNLMLYDVDTGAGAFLPPGASCPMLFDSLGSGGNNVDFIFQNPANLSVTYDAGVWGVWAPMVMGDTNFMVVNMGSWPVNCFGIGFGLGLAVAGPMLMLWIIGLLYRPVVES